MSWQYYLIIQKQLPRSENYAHGVCSSQWLHSFSKSILWKASFFPGTSILYIQVFFFFFFQGVAPSSEGIEGLIHIAR